MRFPDVTQTVADWAPNCAVEAAVAHESTYPSRKSEYGPVLSWVMETGSAVRVSPLTLETIGVMGDQLDLIAKLQRYTCPFNTTGSPTITLPGGFSEAGLPIAFQLVAADLGELALIRAGVAFQSATPWHRRHPIG